MTKRSVRFILLISLIASACSGNDNQTSETTPSEKAIMHQLLRALQAQLLKLATTLLLDKQQIPKKGLLSFLIVPAYLNIFLRISLMETLKSTEPILFKV